MPALPQRGAVRLAVTPGALLHIAQSLPQGTEWPPPDTHIVYTPGGLLPASPDALSYEVVSDAGPLSETGFWWTTLGNLLVGSPDSKALQAATTLAKYLELVPGWLGNALAIPVYFEAPEGISVRWLQVTYRGTLFGEQFQHKQDWGKPGNDPTTTEAEALTLASGFAGSFASDFMAAGHADFCDDVTYKEVGVVECTQSSAGGDVTESFGTQWFMWGVGTEPKGTGGIPLPYEVSCAVTLQTDHRGQSGRGRFYWPPFSTNLMATHGLYTASELNFMGQAWGAHIDAIKTSTDLVPVVVSRAHQILNEVTSINIGRVPDSQRRRRRSLSEDRQPVWIST